MAPCKIQYFAYGSNMLVERLRARCASATPIAIAAAHGFSLAFSKRGRDNSGKATLLHQPDKRQSVPGVIFEIDVHDLHALDHAEGHGYARHDHLPVTIIRRTRTTRVTTYIATPAALDAQLVPFNWYRDLIIAGAQQHGLPQHHISQLLKVPAISDPLPQRPERIKARAALAQAGYVRE